MVAIVQNDLRVHVCRNFINAVDSSVDDDKSYYLYFGRSRAWADDTVPDTPEDNKKSYNELFTELLAAKRITADNIVQAIPRNNWESGTVYDIYRHDYSPNNPSPYTDATDLFEANFYVVNTELNVYKCIDNNRGAESTVEPTGTSTAIQTLSDGYRWKFMYGLTSQQGLRFVAPDFIIAKRVDGDDGTGQLEVQDAAVPGSIEHVEIENAGADYAAGDTVNLTGDGTNFTAEVESVDANGAIERILITDPGQGYTLAEATISSTNGTGAEIVPIISPIYGHGGHAVYELGGHFAFINVTVTGEEGDDFPVNNDFRMLGIIYNPMTSLPSNNDPWDPSSPAVANLATNDTVSLTRKLDLSSITGELLPEDTFEGQNSGAVGRVVTFNSDTNVLRFTQQPYDTFVDFQVGETVQFQNGESATIDAITEPDVVQGTGLPFYQENRRPIIRTIDQQEDIKLVIEW